MNEEKPIGLEEKKKGKKSIRGWIQKHKKLAILLVLFLCVIAVVFGVQRKKKRVLDGADKLQMIETAAVERMDLSNSISVTGTIASASKKTGSTSLKDLEVEKVYVSVGDTVKKGDLICTFDGEDIEEALEKARNNYQVNQQLEALEDYEAEYQETVEHAEETLQKSRDTRDAYKKAYANAIEEEEKSKTSVQKAQAVLEEKQAGYEAAKTAALEKAQEYEKNTAAGGSGTPVNDLEGYLANIEKNSTAYEYGKTQYETYEEAKTAYEAAMQNAAEAQSAYERAKTSTTAACEAYEKAQESRTEAQTVYEDTLEKAQDTYERSRLNAQLEQENSEEDKIEEYEEQLEGCQVYAAMDGVITSLLVEEGEDFSGGVIYEIQDMEHFIVEASVDEYDIVDLKKGMSAYVKTDSMGEEEMEAELTYVAPTGTSGMQMGSDSGTASYEIEITIKDTQDRLRPGMTAQVSISLEESKDALAVPYDCVQTNPQGETVVYVEDQGERKEVVVETGIETDYYTELISEEIKEGMKVYLGTQLLRGTDSESTRQEEMEMQFSFGTDGGGRGGFQDGPAGNGMPSGGGSMPSGGPGGF